MIYAEMPYTRDTSQREVHSTRTGHTDIAFRSRGAEDKAGKKTDFSSSFGLFLFVMELSRGVKIYVSITALSVACTVHYLKGSIRFYRNTFGADANNLITVFGGCTLPALPFWLEWVYHWTLLYWYNWFHIGLFRVWCKNLTQQKACVAELRFIRLWRIHVGLFSVRDTRQKKQNDFNGESLWVFFTF